MSNLLNRKIGYESGGNFEYIDDVFFHIGGAGYKDKNFVKMGLDKLMECK